MAKPIYRLSHAHSKPTTKPVYKAQIHDITHDEVNEESRMDWKLVNGRDRVQ